jgi:hypothetical protein
VLPCIEAVTVPALAVTVVAEPEAVAPALADAAGAAALCGGVVAGADGAGAEDAVVARFEEEPQPASAPSATGRTSEAAARLTFPH